MNMESLSLSGGDLATIDRLLGKVSSRYHSVEDPKFLKDCGVLAHELPASIRLFLTEFRFSDPAWGICLISGCPIDDEKIGETPAHWRQKAEGSILKEEFLLALMGALLGDLFSWAAEQDGHIIHEVIPIKDHENRQMSTRSLQDILWHTEDAFQRYSSDYIGLL
jgi:L-asparagine oxygenase